MIGGPGAFVIPVTAPEQLFETIRRKLVLEIAGLPARIVPAAADGDAARAIAWSASGCAEPGSVSLNVSPGLPLGHDDLDPRRPQGRAKLAVDGAIDDQPVDPGERADLE